MVMCYIMVGIIIGFMFKMIFDKICSNYDGKIIIDDNDDQKTRWILDVNTDPEEIPKKKVIHLQVHVQK